MSGWWARWSDGGDSPVCSGLLFIFGLFRNWTIFADAFFRHYWQTLTANTSLANPANQLLSTKGSSVPLASIRKLSQMVIVILSTHSGMLSYCIVLCFTLLRSRSVPLYMHGSDRMPSFLSSPICISLLGLPLFLQPLDYTQPRNRRRGASPPPCKRLSR